MKTRQRNKLRQHFQVNKQNKRNLFLMFKKMFHKVIITNTILKQFGLTDTNVCNFCLSKKDSVYRYLGNAHRQYFTQKSVVTLWGFT